MTLLFSDPVTLSASERTILRLKALIGPATSRTEFQDCLARLGFAGLHKTLSPALTSLCARGFLTKDLACAPAYLHPMAVEAMAAPEGAAMIQVIRSFLPPDQGRRYWDREAMEADTARWMRLAVYLNDAALFGQQKELRGRHCHNVPSPMDAFAGTDVGVDWLSARHPSLQWAILQAKADRLISTGIAAPDYADLMAYCRRTPSLRAPCFAMIADFYAWSGHLGDLATWIATPPVGLPEDVPVAFAAVHALLSGNVTAAVGRFSEALRLHRRVTRKRKSWLPGYIGLLHLCALLASDDASHHAEIEAALEIEVSIGHRAIRALFELARNRMGTVAEAVDRDLTVLATLSVVPPFSSALLMVAAVLVDPGLARRHAAFAAKLFRLTEQAMPLAADMLAEALAAILDERQTERSYADFLSRPGREVSFRFLGLIVSKAPWERSLASLEAMFSLIDPLQADPAIRNKRLVWRIDAETQAIEAVEQTLQVRGWSAGRPVSLKRLYQEAGKLDHIDEFDRRAVRAIRHQTGGWNHHEYFELSAETGLPALIGHPRLFDMESPAQPVELVEGRAELVLSSEKAGFRLTLSHAADSPGVFIEKEAPGRWRVVVIDAKAVEVAGVLGDGLTVPVAARDRLTALAHAQAPSLPVRIDTPEIEDAAAVAGDPAPVVRLTPRGEGLKVSLVVRPFGAEGPHFLPGLGGRLVTVGTTRVRRDVGAERHLAALLVDAIPSLGGPGPEWLLDDQLASLEFLSELRALPAPPAMEWPEGQSLTVRGVATAKRFKASVKGADGWFTLGGAVSLDEDKVVDLKELLVRLDQARGRFVPLEDGGFLALDHHFQQQLEKLRRLGEGLKIPMIAGVAVRDMLEEAGAFKADDKWQEFARRLDEAGDWQPRLPVGFEAELRDYQADGYAWMSRLARWGAGALLADDMGLGKTVQAIAVMVDKAGDGPSLVVAPTSVCGNWVAELTRFAPGLKAHRLAEAGDRAGILGTLGPGDVLIASYGLLAREEDNLTSIAWAVAILDEAQAIKNPDTQRAKSSQRLQAGFRLALTGTPVENDLEELWSLFCFVNPRLLGSRKAFGKRFGAPIARDNDPHAKAALKALVRPFLLRRTKAAVMAELPARTEQTLWIEMNAEERAFYEALRRRALEKLEETVGPRTRIHILAEITRLRQACCHPALAVPESDMSSAKLATFLELVEELREGRHRALVFSQFVGHLGKIRAALDEAGVSYQYLDGTTPAAERDRRVAAFQAGTGELFLISLKAGGFGLNLTAADYVIHLDPWWNPAVEDQASDRAHRIGQLRPVTIYRLIVKDTIEEGIVALHRQKRDLADALLEGTDVSGRLSEEDLLGLIRDAGD